MNIDDVIGRVEGLRREAYVKAVMRDDVIGCIGSHAPFDALNSLGLWAIPVHGMDGSILKFSVEEGLCPLVDATVTYAKTDKCPLIHSSKIIVVDDFCPVMTREMSKLKDKNIFVYRKGSENALFNEIFRVYGNKRLSMEKCLTRSMLLNKLNTLIEGLKSRTELTGMQVYILEYYTKFLDPCERVELISEISREIKFSDEPEEFIPVRVQDGAGIYRQIDEIYSGRKYRILENFCNINGNYDFVYENCPYCEGKRINYMRED